MFVPFIAVIATILVTQQLSTERGIVSGMQATLTNVSEGTVDRSQAFLDTAAREAAFAAELIEGGDLQSTADLEGHFDRVLSTAPQASGVFYGTVDGHFTFVSRNSEVVEEGFRTKVITEGAERTVELRFRDELLDVVETQLDPTDSYDPTVRPWFQEAAVTDGAIFTDPYVFFSSQQPGVTSAVAVRDDAGELLGVVGVDLELESLSGFLEGLSLGEGGSAFIASRDNVVIAVDDGTAIHQPDGDGFRLSTAEEVDQPMIPAGLAALGSATSSRLLTVDSDAGVDHGIVVPLGIEDWVLGVSLSEEDFLGPVRTTNQNNTLLAVGLSLAAMLLFGLLGHKVLIAEERAVQASDAKSAFVARLSHEIRTPLNAIMGLAELTRLQVHGPIEDHEYLEYAADIKRAADHLNELVSDSLDLAKIEADRIELAWTTVDVVDLTADVVRLIKAQAAEADIDLTHSHPDTSIEAVVDSRRVRQMLINLIVNAIGYTPSGGSVSVDSRMSDDGEILLTVSDSGHGMSATDISVALRPFGQLESDRRPENGRGGTGLGLPLTKAFAEAHGGHLDIRSTPGVGTEMSIVLPAIEAVDLTGDAESAPGVA